MWAYYGAVVIFLALITVELAESSESDELYGEGPQPNLRGLIRCGYEVSIRVYLLL